MARETCSDGAGPLADGARPAGGVVAPLDDPAGPGPRADHDLPQRMLVKVAGVAAHRGVPGLALLARVRGGLPGSTINTATAHGALDSGGIRGTGDREWL
jgi:hypothetical protein